VGAGGRELGLEGRVLIISPGPLATRLRGWSGKPRGPGPCPYRIQQSGHLKPHPACTHHPSPVRGGTFTEPCQEV